MVNEQFLESKLSYYQHPYYGECLHKCSSGNITRISDNVFTFVEYNFLPGDDGQLDGHYRFYVNYKTFDYLICQESYYGSFTYTTPPKQKEWIKNLIPRELKKVESIIAHKLLGAYFYSYEDINRVGASLIEGTNGRRCLITDYRGYIWTELNVNSRSETDLKALSLIDKEFNKISCSIIKVGKVSNKRRTSMDIGSGKNKGTIYGYYYELPIHVNVNGKEEVYVLHRGREPIYFNNFNFEKDGGFIMGHSQNWRGKPSELVKILPKLIESL